MDRAAANWRHVLLFAAIAATGCAIDLLTKHWAFTRADLVAHEVRWFWPGHVGLQLSLNEGALFGMGQGMVPVFAAFGLAACLAIPWWLVRGGAGGDWRLVVVLGAILAGVLGNLYDRVGLPGLDWGFFNPARAGEPVYAVRDFILLAGRWGENPQDRLVWPNFNVADSFLVCGACALFLLSLRKENRSENS